MLTETANRLGSFFASGYDAIASTTRRKSQTATITHEDEQLKGRDRRQLISTGQSLHRNSALLGWAISKHCDYCTAFDFHCRTGNEAFDEDIERRIEVWSRAGNCDITGRHPLRKFLRLLETRRVLDGDVFLIKRAGGQLQAVESDRIRQPDKPDRGANWINGCRVDTNGRTRGYALHNRLGGNRYEYVKQLQARNVIHHAHVERFDQVRGISPMAAAFNSFVDSGHFIDMALAKMRVEQLFAMAITSAAADGFGEHTKSGDQYDCDLGVGPVKLELNPGDDVKFLKSDSPAGSAQQFLSTVIGIALKSLGIPYTFFDESHTNFFGSRAAWLLYDRAIQTPQAAILEVLRQITIWKLRTWLLDEKIVLPTGMGLSDLQWEWVPKSREPLDPEKDLKAQRLALSLGFDNPYRICKQRGSGEYEDNISQIAKAQAFATDHGVRVNFSDEPAPAVELLQPEVAE